MVTKWSLLLLQDFCYSRYDYDGGIMGDATITWSGTKFSSEVFVHKLVVINVF